MLYAMGDKEKSFIGSKQWIGAVEISMCLDEYWGVRSCVEPILRTSLDCV